MFSLKDIKEAHSKVKSKEDFLNYINELEDLGMSYYDLFVENGSAVFYSTTGEILKSDGTELHQTIVGSNRIVNSITKKKEIEYAMKIHQNGHTTFIEFIDEIAKSGISYWRTDLKKRTVSYINLENEVVIQRKF